jgi:hypothetical protein
MTNGGIIGPKNNTTGFVVSGVWSLQEQLDANKKNIWGQNLVATYITSINNNADASSYTFTVPNLTSITSRDTLVIALQYGETVSRPMSSVTVGGISCILDTTNDLGGMNTQFARISGYSGTQNATVVVSISGGTTQRMRASFFRISDSQVSLHTTQQATAGSGTTQSITMNMPPGSVGFVGAFHGSQGTPTTLTSGGVTQSFGADLEAASYASVGFIQSSSIDRPSNIITKTHSNSSQAISLRGVVYKKV